LVINFLLDEEQNLIYILTKYLKMWALDGLSVMVFWVFEWAWRPAQTCGAQEAQINLIHFYP